MTIFVEDKLKPGVVGNALADGEDIAVDATGFGGSGNLETTDTTLQLVAEKLNTYAGASPQDLENAILNLPAANPNFYYERLTPSSGLATPSSNIAILATGDGTDVNIIPQKNSVGGILADIPFENLFQGQLEVTSDVACSLEITGRFTHFAGLPNAFTIERTVRLDLEANQPDTEDLNGFSSEVIVPLGDITVPGIGTFTITQDILDAAFPYEYDFRFTAYQLGSTTTRIAANLSDFRLISHAIIFKQARQIVGPRGEQGPPGTSPEFAPLAAYDTLFSTDNQTTNASSTAFTTTLTFSGGRDSISDYGLIEIGTSATSTGEITYTTFVAETVARATSSEPYNWLGTSTTGARLTNALEVYSIGNDQIGILTGTNRPFIRLIRGIIIGTAATPSTWRIRDSVITPDTAASPATALLPGGSTTEKNDAFRIGANGFLREQAVTKDDWALALVDSPSPSVIDGNWDIISGNRFPVSSTLFHFSENITESDTEIRGDQLTGVDFGVWISDTVFATAPFLDPTGDPNNPRPTHTLPYIGGRTPEFTVPTDRFHSILTVGIQPTFITTDISNDLSLINIVIDRVGETEIVLNLRDDFHELTFNNPTFRYFSYSTVAQTDSFTEINIRSGDKIRAYEQKTGRTFELTNNVDVTSNVNDLPESRLALEVRTKLNAAGTLDHEDQFKLDEISPVSTDEALTTIPTTNVRFKVGDASSSLSDYTEIQIQDGIVADFVDEKFVILVPSEITLTSIGSDSVTEIFPSVVAGYNTYTATISGSSDPLNDIRAFNGTIATVTELDLSDLYKVDQSNLTPTLLDAINHPRNTLPDTLQAISAGSELFHFGNSGFVSQNSHIGTNNMFVIVKNLPAAGTDYPLQDSSAFVNEITGAANVFPSPPSSLSNIYFPTQIISNLGPIPTDGLALETDNTLIGQGISKASFVLNYSNDTSANYRIVIGGWVYWDTRNPPGGNLIRIKEVGNNNTRSILNVDQGHLAFSRSNQNGGTSSRVITHNLTATRGQSVVSFSGAATGEDFWSIYEARAYTITFQLRDTSNDENSDLNNQTYTVTNINTDQSASNLNLTFTGFTSGNRNKTVSVQYTASSHPYEGPSNTIRISVAGGQLGSNEVLTARITYTTSVTVRTNNTYTDTRIGPRVYGQRLHKFIISLRKSDTDESLVMNSIWYGYDGTGRAQVFENITSNFNYNWHDLDYSRITIGDISPIIQNIQGFKYNEDTPLTELATLNDMKNWILHHDDKVNDYIWDLVRIPTQDVEAVRIRENVSFSNLIFIDPDTSTRWRLSVNDNGDNTASSVWTLVT